MEKIHKYVGEIIDRSWFDDDEAYEEGTYYATPIIFHDITGDILDICDNDEFYQAIVRSNRIYLDEYPEQKRIRKIWMNSRYDIKSFKCAQKDEHYDLYEHFYLRFTRKN